MVEVESLRKIAASKIGCSEQTALEVMPGDVSMDSLVVVDRYAAGM